MDIAAVELLSQDLKAFLGYTFTGCTSSTPTPGLPSTPNLSHLVFEMIRDDVYPQKRMLVGFSRAQISQILDQFLLDDLGKWILKAGCRKMDDLGKPHFGKSSDNS